MILDKIASFLNRFDRFLITSHSRPDGDSIGTQLAFRQVLGEQGKEAEIINSDPFPRSYQHLPGIERIQIQSSVPRLSDYGLIVLECANFDRTGLDGLNGYSTLNIDHHPINDFFGEVNWVDPSAAAVAEMAHAIFQRMGWQVSRDTAINLYTAILTDTGSFQFSNTTARTFQVASELVSAGANPADIAQDVLLRQSKERLMLTAKLLETLELNSGGKIASVRMDRKMLEDTGANRGDTEGLVNYPLSIDGVTVCAFFREEDQRNYRVSLRSKGDLDVGQVAKQFGGGGHRNAAGLSITGSFEEVRRSILQALNLMLDSHGA